MTTISASVVVALAMLASTAMASRAEDKKTYKVVDAADLRIGTHKYVGKDIEVRQARCYYADVDDYRCSIGSGVAIFTDKIVPEASRKRIEENCDAVRKMLTSDECLTGIRFNFTEATDDLMDGYQRRIVLKPDQIEIPIRKGR